MDAWCLEFFIEGEDGRPFLHKKITFPYAIDAKRIDADIAKMLIKISEEKEKCQGKLTSTN